jgi:hypothetical protein
VAFVYTPRAPTAGVLYEVVRGHLAAFLATVAARTDGAGLPAFVTKEFRKFLGCGVLSRGFARVRCPACAFERLVPFSCKGRGFCPSCGGRRMTERAAHLVDHVFPLDVPVRQWVLSVPHRLRYRLAYDHTLCRAVVRAWVRVLRAFYRRRARQGGVADGETGMVTGVQRFGGAVNLHVHAHTLVLDGVFALAADGTLVFHPAAPPTTAELQRVAASVRRRIGRLLLRRGIELDADVADPLADESVALAGLSQAAVQGRSALGRCAGRGPERLGADPDAPWVDRHGPFHAHDAGFDLHAGVTVAAGDRAQLERLCCYVFRPPLGQHRLRRLGDGRIAVELQRPWADGTTHLVFTPAELLERLATLVPRPRVNLLLYHGVLAPNARWRRAVVPSPAAEESSDAPSARVGSALASAAEIPASPRRARPKYRAWADLMRRAFEADVLACPRCGGRMILLATIEDAAVITRILTHLGLSLESGEPDPAHPPPEINGVAGA